MTNSSIAANLDRESHVLATFIHEHRFGTTLYSAIVPSDTNLPSATIGGEQPVDEDPEEWALYQTFITLLDINFDENDSRDFLTCHCDPMIEVPILTGKDIDSVPV